MRMRENRRDRVREDYRVRFADKSRKPQPLVRLQSPSIEALPLLRP
jgi:hypothetical protein